MSPELCRSSTKASCSRLFRAHPVFPSLCVLELSSLCYPWWSLIYCPAKCKQGFVLDFIYFLRPFPGTKACSAVLFLVSRLCLAFPLTAQDAWSAMEAELLSHSSGYSLRTGQAFECFKFFCNLRLFFFNGFRAVLQYCAAKTRKRINTWHANPGTVMSVRILLHHQRLKLRDKSMKFRAKANYFL